MMIRNDTKGSNMKSTIIGFVPVESPLYVLHPVTRLILFIVTGLIPMFIERPEINLLFMFSIMILFLYARVDISGLKIYLPMMITVGLFIFLTYIFFPGDDPNYVQIGSILGLKLYYQPLRWAFMAYIRILTLLWAAIFFFSTNRERDILTGFRGIGTPFVISYFIGLSLRSVGMFLEDYKTIREAEQSRGLDMNSLSFFEKVKKYSMYIIPLFTIAFRRGDEITNALFAKGFTFNGKVPGKKQRADYILSTYNYSIVDITLIIFLILFFILMIYLKVTTQVFSIEQSVFHHYFWNLIN